jgi:copper chaperone CopZ
MSRIKTNQLYLKSDHKFGANMRLHFILIASAFVLSACSSDSQLNEKTKENTSKSQTPKINANRLLSMEVDGMVCEMGCGSSIRKELKETGAVLSCDFDFEDGRKLNTAKITFDKNKITVDELIDVVNTLNDKQFKVGKTSSQAYVPASIPEEEEAYSSVNARVNITSPQIEVPNFLELLSRFLIK